MTYAAAALILVLAGLGVYRIAWSMVPILEKRKRGK